MMPDRILTALMAFFDQEEWSYERLPDKPILKLRFAGQNGNWMPSTAK